MLLRRITKHVNDQNWFAVALDFFIVVFGVFMGFQVQQWSESRREQDDTKQYLQRLVTRCRAKKSLNKALSSVHCH